jgi:hypothetical protein
MRKRLVSGTALLWRLEGDGVTEILQSAERAFHDALLLPRLKKGGPEVAVGLLWKMVDKSTRPPQAPLGAGFW